MASLALGVGENVERIEQSDDQMVRSDQMSVNAKNRLLRLLRWERGIKMNLIVRLK